MSTTSANRAGLSAELTPVHILIGHPDTPILLASPQQRWEIIFADYMANNQRLKELLFRARLFKKQLIRVGFSQPKRSRKA